MNRIQAERAQAEVVAALRMPSIQAIRDKVVAFHPMKSWVFVSPEGRAFIVLDGSDLQISRARSHLNWLVGIYGGKEDGIPSLDEIEQDIARHLRDAEGVAA